MPDGYPDFLRAAQMPAYLTSYAEHFGLVEHIQCNARLERVLFRRPAGRQPREPAPGKGDEPWTWARSLPDQRTDAPSFATAPPVIA